MHFKNIRNPSLIAFAKDFDRFLEKELFPIYKEKKASAENQELLQRAKEENARKIETQNLIAKAQALKGGEISPENIRDEILLHDASDDLGNIMSVPVDGPADPTKYFAWSGTLLKKIGDFYVCSHWSKNMFSFKDVKHVYSDGGLRQGDNVVVVGQYSGNGSFNLLDGSSVQVPVLTNCAVSTK